MIYQLGFLSDREKFRVFCTSVEEKLGKIHDAAAAAAKRSEEYNELQ